MTSWMLLRERPLRVSMINMLLLRDILRSHVTLSFKYSETVMVTMYTLTSATALSSAAIKRSSKRHHLKLLSRSALILGRPQSRLPKLSAM